MKPSSDNPDLALEMKKQDQSKKPQNISESRYAEQKEAVYAEIDTDLEDKYSASYKKTAPIAQDKYDEYKTKLEQQSPEESQVANGDWNLYELTIKNVGDLVMPIIIKFDFVDGSSDIKRIPVEIWRYNTMEISKVFTFSKEVVQITLDPYLETADTDLTNNYYPEKSLPSRFDLYKAKSQTSQKADAPTQRQRKTGSGN
ncbi:MAG: hypothetical protein ABIV51_13875 [Saprospiraceae bacterium]